MKSGIINFAETEEDAKFVMAYHHYADCEVCVCFVVCADTLCQ